LEEAREMEQTTDIDQTKPKEQAEQEVPTEQRNEPTEVLVPQFVVPLGTTLAELETAKQRLLTNEEIIECRDKEPCVMMKAEDVEKLSAVREFVDIHAENVLADWHRRRIEFCESFWPSLVFYVPTKGEVTQDCRELLDAREVKYEIKPHSKTLHKHFEEQASWYTPVASGEEIASIAEHTDYFVLRTKPFKSSQALEISAPFIPLIGELLDLGALGVSLETANLVHSKEAWMRFVRRFREQPLETCVFSLAQMPVTTPDSIISIGMHCLGQPDYSIKKETLLSMGFTPENMGEAACNLFQSLATYLIGTCPPNSFISGNTFSITADAPRLKVDIQNCNLFKDADIRYNPFGVWHLSRE
jgi:hypothetical protein